MRKIAIAISFDDGRKDNYDVAVPILKKYGLSASFNIATAYVDGSINPETRPCPNEAMSRDNVVEIAKAGFEIACHGDHHRNDIEDIKAGAKKLRIWMGLSKDDKLGFASPCSSLSIEDIEKNLYEYKKLFSYVRIASSKKENVTNRVVRKVAHLTHSKKLYCKAFYDNLGGLEHGFIATSIPILHKTTIGQIIALIVKAKKEGKDCILMFHSVLNPGEEYYNKLWSYDATKFEELCAYLSAEMALGSINVLKTKDLI